MVEKKRVFFFTKTFSKVPHFMKHAGRSCYITDGILWQRLPWGQLSSAGAFAPLPFINNHHNMMAEGLAGNLFYPEESH